MFHYTPSVYDLGNSANDNVATCASRGLMKQCSEKMLKSGDLELYFEK